MPVRRPSPEMQTCLSQLIAREANLSDIALAWAGLLLSYITPMPGFLDQPTRRSSPK